MRKYALSEQSLVHIMQAVAIGTLKSGGMADPDSPIWITIIDEFRKHDPDIKLVDEGLN